MADNADGVTFRAFDVRGEFPRFLDDGRGIDASRVLGSWQDDEIKSHTHAIPISNTTGPGGIPVGGPNFAVTNQTQATGGNETRPRNTAFSAMLKF